MKKSLQYFGGAAVFALLGYLCGAIVLRRVPLVGAPFAIAAFGLMIVGWWHFAKWVWGLLVGKKR